ncbi:MAG: hypothetical protein WBE37_32920 [Bryobacteraceae bacterium]
MAEVNAMRQAMSPQSIPWLDERIGDLRALCEELLQRPKVPFSTHGESLRSKLPANLGSTPFPREARCPANISEPVEQTTCNDAFTAII